MALNKYRLWAQYLIVKDYNRNGKLEKQRRIKGFPCIVSEHSGKFHEKEIQYSNTGKIILKTFEITELNNGEKKTLSFKEIKYDSLENKMVESK